MPGRARANGEGSIFPYRNGFAAYVWVTKPDGKRSRKYVYGKTREEVHDKWIKLHAAGQGRAGRHQRARRSASTSTYWLREIVEPNLAPGTYATYEMLVRLYIVPGLGREAARQAHGPGRADLAQRGRVGPASAAPRARTNAGQPDKRRCCALGRCCQDLPSATTVTHIRTVLRAAAVPGDHRRS